MNFLKKLVVGAALLAPVGLTGTASAQTTHTNVASFAASAGATTTIDFAACGPGGSITPGATLVGSGACSGLPSGVDFAPSTGGTLYVVAINQSKNPTTALGITNPKGGEISFNLNSFATSFAAQFFQNFGGGSQSLAASFVINFYNGNAQFASSTFSVLPDSGTFLGVTGLEAFDRVTISQPTGYAVIDDVRFGNLATVVTAAPEPATWAMMLLGFGAAGFAMRRAPRRASLATKA